jgi:hypothetical protein
MLYGTLNGVSIAQASLIGILKKDKDNGSIWLKVIDQYGSDPCLPQSIRTEQAHVNRNRQSMIVGSKFRFKDKLEMESWQCFFK